jgi:hypothetical protein
MMKLPIFLLALIYFAVAIATKPPGSNSLKRERETEIMDNYDLREDPIDTNIHIDFSIPSPSYFTPINGEESSDNHLYASAASPASGSENNYNPLPSNPTSISNPSSDDRKPAAATTTAATTADTATAPLPGETTGDEDENDLIDIMGRIHLDDDVILTEDMVEADSPEASEVINFQALREYTSSSTGPEPIGRNGRYDPSRVFPNNGGLVRQGEPRRYPRQDFVFGDFTLQTPDGNQFNEDALNHLLEGNAVSIYKPMRR